MIVGTAVSTNLVGTILAIAIVLTTLAGTAVPISLVGTTLANNHCSNNNSWNSSFWQTQSYFIIILVLGNLNPNLVSYVKTVAGAGQNHIGYE